ncbi:hypothetical protein RJT34_11510 [Clitoria ternatea]|uniref:Uncharacterized protein n=1 Tax=Clitoria ternatea TaxID=43366 RepID=A0AAN9PKK6_CLITE
MSCNEVMRYSEFWSFVVLTYYHVELSHYDILYHIELWCYVIACFLINLSAHNVHECHLILVRQELLKSPY